MNDSFAGTLSLVIAITGHRDLYPEDFEALRAEVGKVFEELKKAYPHTPLLLLSGLAKGADRIAVEAAIAANIPYIAVLPMPEHLYRQDFETEDSDADFEKLRSAAARCIVLPLEESTVEPISAEARDKQYERL